MKESSQPVHRVSSGTVQYDRRLRAVGDVVVRSIAEWMEPSGIIARDLYLDGVDILQCVSGGFRFVLDGMKAVNLDPGEALVVYPQHRMTFEALENDNRLVSVVLCGTSVKDYLDAMGFYHGQHGRTILQLELLAKIREMLKRLPADTSVEDKTCLSLMTDVLQSMVQDFREQGNPFIYDAIRQIRVNLECGVVRLEPLCEQLHVSRAHLHAAFVQAGLESPSVFIRNEQKDLALRLLQSTSMPITEVAHKAGFISMTHFANFMRKYTGKSAHEWRTGGMASSSRMTSVDTK